MRHAASGRSSGFGALAELAAKQDVPAEPKLKSPDQFRLIGTDVAKLDTAAKTTGEAQFTLDLHRDIRIRDNGAVRYVFNYGPETVDVGDLAEGRQVLFGETALPPRGVLALARL